MTLADKAYEAIRRDIVTGSLTPGQPLRMAMLSKRYEMGMSPLREALNRLQSERLVDAVSLKGFTVATLSVQELADTTKARMLIECEALRLSIRKGDDAWETGIVAALHALSLQSVRAEKGDAADVELLEKRHHAFHRALISASGSRWLMSFFEKLYAEAERYRYHSLTARRSRARRDVDAEHSAIAEATIARDADKACELLSDHYRRTQDFVIAHFAEAADPIAKRA